MPARVTRKEKTLADGAVRVECRGRLAGSERTPLLPGSLAGSASVAGSERTPPPRIYRRERLCRWEREDPSSPDLRRKVYTQASGPEVAVREGRLVRGWLRGRARR